MVDTSDVRRLTSDLRPSTAAKALVDVSAIPRRNLSLSSLSFSFVRGPPTHRRRKKKEKDRKRKIRSDPALRLSGSPPPNPRPSPLIIFLFPLYLSLSSEVSREKDERIRNKILTVRRPAIRLPAFRPPTSDLLAFRLSALPALRPCGLRHPSAALEGCHGYRLSPPACRLRQSSNQPHPPRERAEPTRPGQSSRAAAPRIMTGTPSSHGCRLRSGLPGWTPPLSWWNPAAGAQAGRPVSRRSVVG